MSTSIIFWRCGLLAYALLVCYLSLAQFQDSGTFKIWDKLAHALVYSGFGILAWLANDTRKASILTLLCCFSLGAVIEFAQGQTAYRDASILDQLANTIGLLAGTVIALTGRLALKKLVNRQ